jgi:hypothetical protein
MDVQGLTSRTVYKKLLHICFKEALKFGRVVHACNPNTLEFEARGSQVQGQPEIHSEFQVSLSYIVRPCLKKKVALSTYELVQTQKPGFSLYC